MENPSKSSQGVLRRFAKFSLTLFCAAWHCPALPYLALPCVDRALGEAPEAQNGSKGKQREAQGTPRVAEESQSAAKGTPRGGKGRQKGAEGSQGGFKGSQG